MSKTEKIEQAKNRMIESLAQNMDLYGITPTVGRLYGTLYFEDRSMTLDELKEELGMSKTSMSTGVRALAEINMIEKVWKRGERKDFYKYKDNWYQNFIDLFCIRWQKGIDMNLEAANRSLQDLQAVLDTDISDEERERAELYMEKIRYAVDYYTWLNKVIELFESEEIFEIIARKENENTTSAST